MQYLPVIYRPPGTMKLNQIEATVAAYIFADSGLSGLDGYLTMTFHCSHNLYKYVNVNELNVFMLQQGNTGEVQILLCHQRHTENTPSTRVGGPGCEACLFFFFFFFMEMLC